MDLTRSLLSWFVSFAKLPKRTITRDDGKPYLERWYLWGEPGGLKYFPEGQTEMRWWQRALTGLSCTYVHRFVASDDDEELHNHPWEATSYILAGGYIEERRIAVPGSDDVPEHFTHRIGGAVLQFRTKRRTVVQVFRPWSRNYIFAETFHKVTLIEDDAWSVIVCGKKVGTWGFLNVETGKFLHWRDHVAARTAKKEGRR